MKKLGKKINLEEQTINAYYNPCADCPSCTCDAHDRDGAAADSNSSYNPSGEISSY